MPCPNVVEGKQTLTKKTNNINKMDKKKLLPVIIVLTTFFSAISAFAQVASVKGVVVDSNGEPVIQAGVVIDGTQTGVVTDIDGTFEINAPKGATLYISSIGFKSKKVYVSGGDLRIVLETEATALDEVVVVGYGSMKRKEMTSAISHIGAKDFSSVSSLDASMLIREKFPE